MHPWDAASGEDEWRAWLASGSSFGQLVVADPGGWPAVVPTHFTVGEERTVLLHLARPNPVWRLIEAQPRVVLSVIGDDAYVPTTWRAAPGSPVTDGVPTSYYAAVQLRCHAEIVDDPVDKAELLRRQLRDLQPEEEHALVAVDEAPYGRLLPGIRGLRLHILDVVAKFKFDDHKSVEHRLAVAERLQQRGQGHDDGARAAAAPTADLPGRADVSPRSLPRPPARAARPSPAGPRTAAGAQRPVTDVQPLPEHLYGAAVALWQQTGLSRSWNDRDADLRRAMTGTSSTVLAAVEQNALLGTAMVGHDGHRGWVYYLAVTPTNQRQGLGRRLMQACEQWAQGRGVPKLQLMVRTENAAVLAFYQRLGYADDQVTVVSRCLDQGVP